MGIILYIMANLLLIASVSLIALTYKQETTAISSLNTEYDSSVVDIDPYSQRVYRASETYRETKGLRSLRLNQKLSQAALRKAQSLCDTGVWSHSPTGRPWYTEIKEAGYEYNLAGENLAKGFKTPEDIVDIWDKSPGHKKNLIEEWNDVGFGYVECNGQNYFAAEYGR